MKPRKMRRVVAAAHRSAAHHQRRADATGTPVGKASVKFDQVRRAIKTADQDTAVKVSEQLCQVFDLVISQHVRRTR